MMRKVIVALAVLAGTFGLSTAAPEPAEASGPAAFLICSYWEESEFFQPVIVVDSAELIAWNAAACHFHWLVAGFCFHTNGVYDRDTGAHSLVPIPGDFDGNPWSVCSFGGHSV